MANVVQLLKDCRNSDPSFDPARKLLACDTLLYVLYWGPIIARELKRQFGPVAIVPIPHPWPGRDPSPPLDANFLQMGDVIRIAMGSPNPQPNIISVAEQLKAATELRAAMERVTKALNAEIKRLQK